MSYAAIAQSWGNAHGQAKLAKGYDRAGDYYNALIHKLAPQTRDYMDPYGVDRRRGHASELEGILSGEQDFRADPAYQWNYDQQMQATSRQNAAAGFGSGIQSSGNAAIALQDRASNVASNEYKSIIERLMKLSGASADYGVAAGQQYGDMVTAGTQGQAEAAIGKYSSLGQAIQSSHTAIGQSMDSLFSDARLKKNIKRVGRDGPLGVYEWTWNDIAEEKLGLTGKSRGLLAQEVKKLMPEAVTTVKGFMALDYSYIEEMREEYEPL